MRKAKITHAVSHAWLWLTQLFCCYSFPKLVQHLSSVLAGQESGDALQNLIGSSSVRCEVRNTDQYGRNVSSCSVLTSKGPQDIGNYMVSNGYAVAYRYDAKKTVADLIK